MTPLRLMSMLVLGSVAFYVLFSRVGMFVEFYHLESQLYEEDLVEHENCMSNHVYAHRAPAKCLRASVNTQRYWRVRALTRTLENTYSCIDYPCTDVLRGVFDSWVSLFVMGGIVTALFAMGFHSLFRRSEQGGRFLDFRSPSFQYPSGVVIEDMQHDSWPNSYHERSAKKLI